MPIRVQPLEVRLCVSVRGVVYLRYTCGQERVLHQNLCNTIICLHHCSSNPNHLCVDTSHPHLLLSIYHHEPTEHGSATIRYLNTYHNNIRLPVHEIESSSRERLQTDALSNSRKTLDRPDVLYIEIR